VEDRDRDNNFSKRVKAGKRTYFFDVKTNKQNDFYISITESRRIQNEDSVSYEKSKVFLYKEDFNKFQEAMNEIIEHVKTELMPEYDFNQFDRPETTESDFGGNDFSYK
jgi:uncharacterized protein YpiB (UPF0302 family)